MHAVTAQGLAECVSYHSVQMIPKLSSLKQKAFIIAHESLGQLGGSTGLSWLMYASAISAALLILAGTLPCSGVSGL